jgi:hypothetical protein
MVLYLVDFRRPADGAPVAEIPGLVYWQGHMIWADAWAEMALWSA